MKHRLTYALAIFSTFIIVGCGGTGDNPQLAEVEGVITLDDIPTEGIFVRFAKEGFRASQGVTDADGRYRLRTYETLWEL